MLCPRSRTQSKGRVLSSLEINDSRTVPCNSVMRVWTTILYWRRQPVVEVQNLWKRYPGTTALGGISLTVERGRVLGVLGENGSGKSTLFKILAGVTRASEGSARISGQPVGVQTRCITSYLPEVSPFYDWMYVTEQLEFLAAFYPGWDPSKSRELLDL